MEDGLRRELFYLLLTLLCTVLLLIPLLQTFLQQVVINRLPCCEEITASNHLLVECALGDFSIEYLCMQQYTFTYEVKILNHYSYHLPINISYELKMGGAVCKGVCDIWQPVMMNARETIEEMIHEGKHIWKTFPQNYSAVFHCSSLWRGWMTLNTKKV